MSTLTQNQRCKATELIHCDHEKRSLLKHDALDNFELLSKIGYHRPVKDPPTECTDNELTEDVIRRSNRNVKTVK